MYHSLLCSTVQRHYIKASRFACDAHNSCVKLEARKVYYGDYDVPGNEDLSDLQSRSGVYDV